MPRGGGGMTDGSNGEPRRIGLPLMIGIYLYPHIFCWFLLRRVLR